MNIPRIERSNPTDDWLLELSERTRIQMSALYYEPNYEGDYWLDGTAPLELLEVVAHYRRCLAREFPPASGGGVDEQTIRESGGHNWIYSSRRFMSGAQLAAGAAGLTQESDKWWFEWIYIHPFERGGHAIDRIKKTLDELYPDCMFVGPFSKPGRAACLKLAGGDTSRLHLDNLR